MEYLVALLVMASVALLVAGVGVMLPGRSAVIRRRLVEPSVPGSGVEDRETGRRERQQRVQALLERVGKRVASREEGEERATTRDELVRAGFRGENAVAAFHGSRALLMFVFGVLSGAVASVFGLSAGVVVLAAAAFAGAGWLLPKYYLKRRIRARQKEIQKSLADTLDLLVVCVEAGLGLNQAFVRVAREIAEVSPATGEELNLVNLEIRAGSSREEALRRLGVRTDLPDVRSMAAMLIQTDRFGTSIARALRVHADTLRTKRRQRAEEAAAKTTIKLVFPLVLFIFPAMFVVILGPAIMHVVSILKDVG